jgi:hypothetical protein
VGTGLREWVDRDLGGVEDAGGTVAAVYQVGVGAGECVDAVVVAGVWEGGQLVEELVCLSSADKPNEPIFGGGRDRVGTDVFRAGGVVAAAVVAAQDVALELVRLLVIDLRHRLSSQGEVIQELNKAGFGPSRIAELLGTTPNTVNVTIQKAKKKAATPKTKEHA